ncbi:unnamed protein product [Anisakis simplex]|uniref:DNA-directed primase/polymerase protein n=1 Tax=Anisakis simplex TaxID=6269 RepID=A0A0M3K3H3_ANISI|nr:unnamed protein product [Anisakis simplex]
MMRKVKMSLFEESLGCFNIYYRQRDALLKREEEGEQSRIFSYEYSGSKEGRRRFLLTTIERFWRWYEQCENVSFYELIPDGCPARLYFDLEFYRGTNQNVDQTQLVNDFSDCVKETLNEVFQIEFDPDKMTVVLDASTQTKFSEHLILHLPGECLFPSNVSMKKSFIDVLEKKMLSTNRGIVWNKDASKTTTLFDAGVYTTNRNFRLYLSTKIGKNNPLVLSDRCHFYANPSAISKKRIFLDSLIVPARYSQSPNVLQTISETTQYSGIVPQPPVVLHIPGIYSSHSINVLPFSFSESSNATNNYIDYMSGYGLTSPYPMLEDYIVTINRSFIVMFSSHFITLSGCRYCYNVGREHRRNHVYWTVDLVRMHCFQKCFDIDCRGTQSNYFPLPPLIRQSISPSTQGYPHIFAIVRSPRLLN